MTPAVKAVFDGFPADAQQVLLAVRALVFEEAEALGTQVEECLKWGQPAYVAPKGSTLRLGVAKTGAPAIFAHCQSRIIPEFSETFGADFEIEGNRAVYLHGFGASEAEKLRFLIRHGLTYKSKD